MTLETANSLFGYFEILYRINRNLLLLCGTTLQNIDFSNDVKVLDIVQDIPRIIPFEYVKKQEKLMLVDRNGLLEFDSEIGYLKTDYCKILNNNYEFLDKIRKIRNKCEHRMHSVVTHTITSSPGDWFAYAFLVVLNKDKKELLSVTSTEFIALIKKLNELFSKLQKDVILYAQENNKTEYQYYKTISRFDFNDFNKIYDSEILHVIGNVMREF